VKRSVPQAVWEQADAYPSVARTPLTIVSIYSQRFYCQNNLLRETCHSFSESLVGSDVMHKSTNQLFSSLRWVVGSLLASLAVAPLLHGATLNVPAGGDFQQALVNAQPGDTIVLAAGVTYTGQFTLPNKSGDAWITIQSSQLASLPAAGRRVTPLHKPFMPRLVCSSCPVLQTAPGAHHYRLIGIEFAPPPGFYAYDVITLGSAGATTKEQQAHHIEFDRVYVHGDPLSGSKRGIALQSAWTTIQNSHFSDFKSDFQDAQAICGWNGPGPYRIENNYLEASGENIMFGGAAPSIQGLIPSDIEVLNNHFRKPPEWVGIWRLKNLFELKNAQRVTVWGNIFENNWVAAQNGYAILFTVRTCEAGDYSWSVVRDVTVTYNYLTNVVGGVNILGQDTGREACGGGTAGQTSNIVIANNVFEKIEAVFLLINSAQSIFIDHNTAFPTRAAMVLTGTPHQEVVFTNNLHSYGDMGIFGDGKGSGAAAIAYYCQNSLFRRNVLFGVAATGLPNHPYDNAFSSTLDGVGFQDAQNGDYRLSSSSAYRKAGMDGLDAGADVSGLMKAIDGVVAGNPQRTEACFISATPTAKSIGADGGRVQAVVGAAAACPWSSSTPATCWARPSCG